MIGLGGTSWCSLGMSWLPLSETGMSKQKDHGLCHLSQFLLQAFWNAWGKDFFSASLDLPLLLLLLWPELCCFFWIPELPVVTEALFWKGMGIIRIFI
ncbi:hypothetical protein CEXT_810201 [Caerostris extrusa]|uniref:Uncharacterized protein n=1 Tax=Caerostris extrusa TaxID=172846 RepID=A0AAV4TZZ4_CAEEX|nr:hypothetical protein CEXT_810201 [Caerostris extrusa]